MGEREEGRQQAIFVSASELRSAGHPFYRAVNRILRDACHLQWYLGETAKNTAHGLMQAFASVACRALT